MKQILFFSFLLFFIISCKKEEFNIINLNGNKITALGHAGMGIANLYPINSYESIIKCLNLGMDGTEFDVQMTKDSVLVLYHNQDLSDNTNVSGIINSLYWWEVKNAYYTTTPYLKYSIISLDQLFSKIDNIQNYKFTFDCKLYTNSNNLSGFYETYINAIVSIIEKYHLENCVYIESQSIEFLEMFKTKMPGSKLFIYPSTFESGLDIALLKGLSGITISSENITKEQITLAHDNNILVAIWNIHSESDNIEAIRKNPDFIQTDKVKNLVELLK